MPEILSIGFKEKEGVFSDLAASVISCQISNCPYSVSYAGNHRQIFLHLQFIFNHFNIRLSLDVPWTGHLQAFGAENMEGFVHFPAVHLHSSRNMAFSDSKSPQALLNPDSEDSL